jgi:AcrR family transcriptional regulator
MGKGELTRQAILEHAVVLASRVGLDGLTIGRLALDLDLSKSGLFAHFRSKEALQVQTLALAAERFTEIVIQPALTAPRGEPRVQALFDRWLTWPREFRQPGGCIFVAASAELDDQPGPARDLLVRLQRDWLDVIAGAVKIAVAEGDFKKSVDPAQFAFETYGIMLVTHFTFRLLRDPQAGDRARQAYSSLLAAARAVPS